VAWHASHTTVGWDLIRHDWCQTLATFVGIDRIALSAREPEDQARFWLKEVERLGPEKGTPNVAAGGAWVLDAPDTKFLQRHFRENKAVHGFPGLPLGAHVELDHDAVSRAVNKFEDLCHERCIGLMEHATSIEPTNIDMWRTRALLLFREDVLGLGCTPRRADWQVVLDECAQHDPENALYDYLAALCEWRSSADRRLDGTDFIVHVREEAGFARGNRRFGLGLEKSTLLFGASGHHDTMAFLELSSISSTDRLTAAESRAIDSRAANLLFSLFRWQHTQYSVQRRNGDPEAAADTLRRISLIVRQVSTTGDSAGMLYEPLILQGFILANLSELSGASPAAVDAQEIQNIDSDRRAVRLELAVISKAYQRLMAKDQPRGHPIETAGARLAVIAQSPAEVLLLLALCCMAVVKLCGKGAQLELARVSVRAQLAAWFSGFGSSYLVFGMCPAGIVSARNQTSAVLALVSTVLLVALIGAFVLLNRKSRIGFSQLIALSISFALLWTSVLFWDAVLDLLMTLVGRLHPLATILLSVALLAAGWFTIKSDLAFLRRDDVSAHLKARLAFLLQILVAFTIPWGPTIAEFVEENLDRRVWVTSRVLSEVQSLGFVAEDLRSGMKLEQHPWLWSLLQWHSYSGPYVGLLLSLLILSVQSSMCLSRATAGGFRQILRQRKLDFLRLIGTNAARTLAIAGAGALLVYLACVPTTIKESEAYYLRHYARLVDPIGARREIDAEIAAIRNDAALMSELRLKAEK